MTGHESPWATGEVGGMADWLRARLERTAREVAVEWGLELGPPFPFARYSYAAPVGDDAVLKVVPVEDDEADHEADALALWDGRGAVRLLRHDPARRVMLIQRARPGTDASAIPEEEAIATAVSVARQLWRPADRGRPFRWIGDEVRRWLANAPDHELVRLAKDVFASLHVGDGTLLHGDFHHYNLLRNRDGWLAIDPKPCAGEPEYDVPTLLWNPLRNVPTRTQAERWIAAFAAIGLDPHRIRQWTIVRGSYLGFPLLDSETEAASPQLRVARLFL